MARDTQPETNACTCSFVGPDEFGNYDHILDQLCPLHGPPLEQVPDG